MADSSLDIKIRTLIEGLDELRRLRDGLEDTTDSVGDLSEDLPEVNTVMGDLMGKVKSLAVAFVALAGVMSLKQAADTAARTETLGVTLGVVAANAGYTAQQISTYEAELRSLGITTQAARESLTQLIQAGVDLSAVNEAGVSKAAELARAAQNLAVVTGENSSDTLQRLIINIRQMDTVGLRYMGLTVDMEAAYEKFAASIGKTADALTGQQRQMAAMNAVMEEATTMNGAYEASMATVGKQLSSMSRYQEEAANAVGRSLLPAYAGVVQEATRLMKTMQEVAEQVQETNFSDTFGEGITNASEALTDILVGLMEFTASLTPAFGQLVQATGELAEVLGQVVVGLTSATTETGIFIELIKTAALLVAGLADGIRLIGGVLSLISSGWTGMLSILTRGIAQIVGLFDNELAASIDGIADRMMAISVASRQSYDSVISDFSRGNTAVQKFIESQKRSAELAAEYGSASTYDEVIEQIRKLTEAQRQGTMNSTEAVAAGNLITASIREMGDASKLTEQQVAQLNQKVQNSLKGVRDAYTTAVKDLKLSLVTIGDVRMFTNLNEEIGKVSGALVNLTENGETTELQFRQAFSRGLESAQTIGDLEKISQALTSARNRAFDVANSADAARIKLNEMLTADLSNARTQEDLTLLVNSLTKLGERGVITGKELEDALSRVAERSQQIAVELQNADLIGPLAALGLTLEGLQSGLSEAGKVGTQALSDIVAALVATKDEARLTGEQFLKLFNESIGTAKTVTDLASMTAELRKANTAGVIMGQTYRDALTEAAYRFDELFQAQLKSANTKTEFDALTESVRKLGETGAISGAEMSRALDDIKAKVDSSKTSMLELAQQATALSLAQVDAVRASNEVAKAQNVLEAEKRRLTELTNTARRDGTKENQAALDLQKAIVRQAQAQAVQAQTNYRLEIAQVDALIAKQRQLNAEKKVEANPTDRAAEVAAQLAGQEAAAKELVVEASKRAVAEQEKVVLATEKAVEQARAFAEQMGVAANNSAETATRVGGVATPDPKRYTSGPSRSPTEEPIKPVFGPRVGVFQREAAMKSYVEAMKEWNKAMAPQRDQERAEKIRDTYAETANRAQAIADGLIKAGEGANLFKNRSSEAANAMNEVRLQALQVAKGAQDAATAFIQSSSSLKVELLQAQGMEEEAAQMRYNQRRQELDLEYQMLRVKLQSAMATARAAGVNTSELSAQLSEANRAYRESLSSLSQLEDIERKARAERKAEAAKESAEKQAALEAEKQGIQEVGEERLRIHEEELKRTEAKPVSGRQSAQMENMLKALRQESAMSKASVELDQALPAATDRQAVQSIAKGTTTTKVVEHKFTDNLGRTVTAQVQEDESERLIHILSEFRRRS